MAQRANKQTAKKSTGSRSLVVKCKLVFRCDYNIWLLTGANPLPDRNQSCLHEHGRSKEEDAELAIEIGNKPAAIFDIAVDQKALCDTAGCVLAHCKICILPNDGDDPALPFTCPKCWKKKKDATADSKSAYPVRYLWTVSASQVRYATVGINTEPLTIITLCLDDDEIDFDWISTGLEAMFSSYFSVKKANLNVAFIRFNMANETVTTEMNRRIQDVVKDKKVGRAIVIFISHANEEGYVNHSRNGADGVHSISNGWKAESKCTRAWKYWMKGVI
ncbi:hypothetical protein DFH11DRAFT_1548689 [Phellopilus nigrolimitatus]|nr:hypothetical protein DFH11DRAFT_1548689 [Phellopilus nigrolimitatus]